MLHPFLEKTADPAIKSTGGKEVVHFKETFEAWVLPALNDNPKLLEGLTLWGGIIVLISVCTIIWSSRKGRANGLLKPLLGALIVGTLMMAPGFILPIILGFIDMGVNAIFSFLSDFTNS